MEEVIKDIVFLSELLEDAYLYYTLANPTEKQQIITKVFSELTLVGDTLNYKCRNGFKALESKKSLIGDPTGKREYASVTSQSLLTLLATPPRNLCGPQ